MPFRAAIEAGVATVMTSHILVPALDPSAIAGAFGFASNNAASDHLARLEAKGRLKRNEIRKLMLAHRGDMAFELPPHRAPAPAAQATAAWHAASLMPHRQQVAA